MDINISMGIGEVRRIVWYFLVVAMAMLSCTRLDCLAMDSVPPTFFSSGFNILLAVMSP